MNDDELLSQLTDAFAFEPSAPPAIGLQALHQSVDVTRTTQRPTRRLPKRWLLPAVASLSALGIGNLALATAGTTLPRIFRAAAYELHLSGDSPALLETRLRFHGLRIALDGDNLAAIEAQTLLLRTSFNRVDVDERRSITAQVLELLALAQSRIALPEDDSTTETTVPTTASPVSSPGDRQEPVVTNPTKDPDARDDANESGTPPARSVVSPTPDTPEDHETTVSRDNTGSHEIASSVDSHDTETLDAAAVADG